MANNPRQKTAPWPFGSQSPAAFEALTRLLETRALVTLITTTPDYLHAEFQTQWLRFIDDVEFVLERPNGPIHVRSASRLGYYDFGTNRRRIDVLHAQVRALVTRHDH